MTFLEKVPRQTEKEFMAQVIRYAELMGWRVYHTWDSRNSASGFPDLVLCRVRHGKPKVVFAEIKSDRGRVSASQRLWINDLVDCGQECHVWRPSQFREVEACLR